MSNKHLIDLGIAAVREHYGGGEPFGKNNQTMVTLPNGQRALLKVGSKGQCMQRAHGDDADAPFTGGLDQVDRVVIAVRTGTDQPIRVYDVPCQVYIDQMKASHLEAVKTHGIKPTDLRVIRFDQKGYPAQRVASKWSEYLIREFDHLYRGNFENLSETELPNLPGEPSSRPPMDPKTAIESAKVMVAEACGVSTDNVTITVTV